MPGGYTWTNEVRSYLFELLLKEKGVNARELYEMWENDPNRRFEPPKTQRALSEHLYSFKKKNGGGSSATSTPKKPRSTSGTKRALNDNDDADVSESVEESPTKKNKRTPRTLKVKKEPKGDVSEDGELV